MFHPYLLKDLNVCEYEGFSEDFPWLGKKHKRWPQVGLKVVKGRYLVQGFAT